MFIIILKISKKVILVWIFKEDGIAECDIKDFSKNIVLYCVFFLVKTIIGYLGIKKQKTKH